MKHMGIFLSGYFFFFSLQYGAKMEDKSELRISLLFWTMTCSNKKPLCLPRAAFSD